MRLHVENYGPQPCATLLVGAEGILQDILGVGETGELVGERAYVRPVTEGRWSWHELPTDIDGAVEFRTPVLGVLIAEVSVCPTEIWELKQS